MLSCCRRWPEKSCLEKFDGFFPNNLPGGPHLFFVPANAKRTAAGNHRGTRSNRQCHAGPSLSLSPFAKCDFFLTSCVNSTSYNKLFHGFCSLLTVTASGAATCDAPTASTHCANIASFYELNAVDDYGPASEVGGVSQLKELCLEKCATGRSGETCESILLPTSRGELKCSVVYAKCNLQPDGSWQVLQNCKSEGMVP